MEGALFTSAVAGGSSARAPHGRATSNHAIATEAFVPISLTVDLDLVDRDLVDREAAQRVDRDLLPMELLIEHEVDAHPLRLGQRAVALHEGDERLEARRVYEAQRPEIETHRGQVILLHRLVKLIEEG